MLVIGSVKHSMGGGEVASSAGQQHLFQGAAAAGARHGPPVGGVLRAAYQGCRGVTGGQNLRFRDEPLSDCDRCQR